MRNLTSSLSASISGAVDAPNSLATRSKASGLLDVNLERRFRREETEEDGVNIL